jgi:hypothetical protein
LPVFDKELFIKIKAFDWLFTAANFLNNNNRDSYLSIGSWDTLMKEAEKLS